MKSCPTCNRTFTDASLSFCIEDGTPLVNAATPPADSEATIVGAPTTRSGGGASAAGSRQGEAPNDWQAPAYQPPGQFSPPATKRRAWPWVVGIVVLLLIGVVGIGIAAAIVIPSMIRAAGEERNSNGNTNSAGNLNANRNANVDSNSNSNTNTNSLIGNGNLNDNASPNANSNANTGLATEAPTDEHEVLADLTALEKEWTEANFAADKKKLARILADDYVGTDASGTIQGKREYLRDIKPEKVAEWEFRELGVTLKGDRATLKGKMQLQRDDDDEELILQFTDKFVWRDNRWQAVASEVSRAK